MEATALSAAKQNIRQLKKQKVEILASTRDRKALKRIQRKVKLLKRRVARSGTREKTRWGKDRG